MQGVICGWSEMPLWLGVRVKIGTGYRCNVTSHSQLCRHAFPAIMAAPLNWGTCASWSFFSRVFEHGSEKSNWHTSIRHFHLLNLEAVLVYSQTSPCHENTASGPTPRAPHVNGEAAHACQVSTIQFIFWSCCQLKSCCLAGFSLFCADFIP